MPTLWESSPAPKLRPETEDRHTEKAKYAAAAAAPSSSWKTSPATIKDKQAEVAKNQFGPMFKDRDHFNSMHFA